MKKVKSFHKTALAGSRYGAHPMKMISKAAPKKSKTNPSKKGTTKSGS